MAISTGSSELIKMMRERLPEDEFRDRVDLMEEAAEFHQHEVLEWLYRDAPIFERELLAVFVLEGKRADSLAIAFENGFRPWWYRAREVSLKWRVSAKLEFATAPEGFWSQGGWWTDASGATSPVPALGVSTDGEEIRVQSEPTSGMLGSGSGSKGEWATAMSQTLLGRQSEVRSVVFPLGVIAIEDDALNGFEVLEWVVFPASCTRFGARSFARCKSLKAISLPAGCKATGDYAFGGCRSLASVVFPVGCVTINCGCFRGCTSLASVKIPDGCTLVDGWAFQHSSLKEIVIPTECEIGEFAFWGCRALTTVTIGEGCVTIDPAAFSYCDALAKVTIGAGCTTIEDSAFWACTNLSSVTLPSTVKSIGALGFGRCQALATIRVPKGCRLCENAVGRNTRVTFV
jgi:hypothetical protein